MARMSEGRKRGRPARKSVTEEQLLAMQPYAELKRTRRGGLPGYLLVNEEFFKVLEKNPRHKKIFLDAVHMYDHDPEFKGNMREAQQLALIDLMVTIHLEYNLDAGSAEAVQEMSEVNKMIRGLLDLKHKMLKEMNSRQSMSYGTDRAAEIKSKYDSLRTAAVDGEYKGVLEDEAEEED